MKPERKAVYCIRCRMWFDTAKGWRANRGMLGLPSCPCCGAPLMELPYEDFVKQNREQNRLDEVMTWEYPDGAIWKEAT